MFEFLDYHVQWSNLETLMLYGLNGNGALEPSLFLRMFHLLPSLKNLCISSFNEDAFADSTLLCLPALESLRLESLPGVTEGGLTQYTSRPESLSLKSFVLVEQNIESLLVISKILSSLRQLERFKFVQTAKCPVMPNEGMVFQPILASSTLKYLHWDVACPDPGTALTQLDCLPFHSLKKSSPIPPTPISPRAFCLLVSQNSKLFVRRMMWNLPGLFKRFVDPLLKARPYYDQIDTVCLAAPMALSTLGHLPYPQETI